MRANHMTISDSTAPLIGAAIAGAAGLIAQVTMPEVPDLERFGGNLVNLGFVVWYAWYTTAKVIPDLQANFKAMQAADREHHVALLAMERADHKDQLLEVTKEMAQIATALNRLADRQLVDPKRTGNDAHA